MSSRSPQPLPPPPSRNRRPRLAAEDVRERMFTAAKDIIRAYGVTISLEEISMDDVVHRAGVARSSAYRIWPYKGDFVNDLLSTFASGDWIGRAGFDARARIIATEVVLKNWERLDSQEGRRAVVREVVRQAVGHTMDSMVNLDREVYIALVATARGNSNDETRLHLAAMLEHTEIASMDNLTTFYTAICKAVGLEPRPGFSFRHLAVAGAAAVEGLALRRVLVEANNGNPNRDPDDWSLQELVLKPLPGPALNGDKPAEWSLAAWTFYGVLYGVVDFVPRWKPTAEGRATVDEFNRQAREDLKAAEAEAAAEATAQVPA